MGSSIIYIIKSSVYLLSLFSTLFSLINTGGNSKVLSQNTQTEKNKNAIKIYTITWEGNTVFSEAELNKALQINVDDPYNKEEVNDRIWKAEDGIATLYMDK